MNELLKNYIESKEKLKKEILEEKKNQLLISQGLCQKEFSKKNTYDPEYPYYEWDEETKENRYCKLIPIEITDNEYEQLLELCESTKEVDKSIKKSKNAVAVVLSIVAWIVILGGLIAGFAFGIEKVDSIYHESTEFSLPIALTYWAVSLISGVLILGFAEIIKLLSEIKNK